MAKFFSISIGNRGGKTDLLSAILAIIAGVSALIWPSYLYYIVGGFLIAIGLIFAFFQFSSVLSAGSVLAGAFIIVKPSLIPYGFAFFLVVLGVTLMFSVGFSVLGILSLLMALVLISNPGSIAILIGVFLLFYGVNQTIKYFQGRRGGQNIPK
jgi:uncharacterized membrane protein HdeD (DUF308 family)